MWHTVARKIMLIQTFLLFCGHGSVFLSHVELGRKVQYRVLFDKVYVSKTDSTWHNYVAHESQGILTLHI